MFFFFSSSCCSCGCTLQAQRELRKTADLNKKTEEIGATIRRKQRKRTSKMNDLKGWAFGRLYVMRRAASSTALTRAVRGACVPLMASCSRVAVWLCDGIYQYVNYQLSRQVHPSGGATYLLIVCSGLVDRQVGKGAQIIVSRCESGNFSGPRLRKDVGPRPRAFEDNAQDRARRKGARLKMPDESGQPCIKDFGLRYPRRGRVRAGDDEEHWHKGDCRHEVRKNHLAGRFQELTCDHREGGARRSVRCLLRPQSLARLLHPAPPWGVLCAPGRCCRTCRTSSTRTSSACITPSRTIRTCTS